MIPTLFHPSREALTAFAKSDATDRRRVARHLERCEDCRRFVGFAQRLEKTLGELPAVAINAGVLSRAIADRNAGARVILPLSDDRPRFGRSRTAVRVGSLLAAGLILGVWASQRRRAPEVHGAYELLLAGFVPRAAEAREGTSLALPPRHSLGTVAATFQRRVVDSRTGSTSNAMTLDFRVAPDSTAGLWTVSARWHDIAEPADMQNARVATESLTVNGESLWPTRRLVHLTPFRRWAGIRIDQRFRGDSVVGEMSLDETTTRRPIAHDLRAERRRLLGSDALGIVYFMGVPVAMGAKFDVSVLGWAVVPNDVLVPTQLKVVASESVTTPAGVFDCWKVAITAGAETHHYWIRKTDHLGVMMRRELGDGRVREVVLLREESPR